jgi:AraC-like DNA-binding protein
MLQLEQYEQESAADIPEEVDEVNIKKMHMAREIIASNLARPCSIIDLAQQVGTNDCYLKKNFKQVFGTTIYGYLQKERMEKSKDLILAGNKKIAEVARIAGYKHASHFTTAFKKYFGYSPNKIRLGFLSFFYDFASLSLFELPVV